MNLHDTFVTLGGEFVIALGIPGILGICFYILSTGGESTEKTLRKFI